MNLPLSNVLCSPTLRKRREGWGTQTLLQNQDWANRHPSFVDELTFFSRHLGHPAVRNSRG